MQELQNLKLANWLWVSSCLCSFIAKAWKLPKLDIHISLPKRRPPPQPSSTLFWQMSSIISVAIRIQRNKSSPQTVLRKIIGRSFKVHKGLCVARPVRLYSCRINISDYSNEVKNLGVKVKQFYDCNLTFQMDKRADLFMDSNQPEYIFLSFFRAKLIPCESYILK